MNIGDKVVHPEYGDVVVTDKKHKALGNKVVFVGINRLGQEVELTGNEPLAVEVEQEQELNSMVVEHQKKVEEKVKNRESKVEQLLGKVLKDDVKVEVKNFPKGEKLSGLLKDLKNAIKEIPEPEKQKDYKNVLESIDTQAKGIQKWNMDILDAIRALPEPKEPNDYTSILEDLKRVTEQNRPEFVDILGGINKLIDKETDLSGVEVKIEQLSQQVQEIVNKPDFEIPFDLIKKDRLKVEVDRVAGAGGGPMDVTAKDFGLDVSRGEFTGYSTVHKFGNAPDFDTADNEVTIWDGAEDAHTWQLMNYVYSTTADIDSISSNNAGDSVDIEVQGLDANYELTVQTVTLNGQTRVALTTPLIRVFRAKNVGSTDLAGHVFVYKNVALTDGVPNTAANIRAVVHAENNQTEMAVYTIPKGKVGYLRSWYASSAGASKDSNFLIKLYARPTGQVFQLKHKASIADVGTSYVQHEYVEPQKFVEKTDIMMTAQMLAAGATAGAVSAGFDIVLIDS